MLEKLISFPYLLAIIFVIAGTIMLIFPPKNINYLYGYRTPNAMKNLKNWTFAQKYAAKKLIIGGIILAIFSLALEFVFKIDENFSGLIIFLGTLVIAAFVFFTTETAIRKFEKNL